MRKFKVLVIAHSLKNNKVAKYGEPVSESQLTSPASELIEAGFIQEVFEEEVIEEETPNETVPTVIDKESISDIKKVNKK